jgi:hypothetical protein
MNVGDLVRTTDYIDLAAARLGLLVNHYGVIVKIVGGPDREQPAWRVTILSNGKLIDSRPWLLEKAY